ncbi:MAG TPA: monovalent cation/H(+) antiporter subunit G [Acidimicrobiales bacterium]|nr:monovalent cation/H(+) antiporter subunit G [Acidimicrobiales bacterium]
MKDVLVVFLAVSGLFFSLSGAVGLVRMPDLYCRIQCSTKNVTMGALPLLLAVVVEKGVVSAFGSRALLVAFLLFVINPLSAHALARAAYRTGIPMWPGAVVDQARAGRREQ